MKAKIPLALCATLLLAVAFSIQPACAQGTDFTYSSYLTKNGSVVSDGLYDLEFKLYDAAGAGTQMGSTQVRNPVEVKNGLFTVLLGFGPGIFNGQTLWLQMGVRTSGSVASYEYLSRQQLTPTPYAIFAESAAGGDGSQWISFNGVNCVSYPLFSNHELSFRFRTTFAFIASHTV